ncbi:MAG TPA: aminotransferase class V-fold PLP-dependent enzyme [Marmoricola sp.]|nr:aminotransferase class V-fold PLP-dependent enzyme [Marmoricola sp.]
MRGPDSGAPTRADADRLDQTHGLGTRDRFLLPERLVYLDGNSLGALPAGVPGRVEAVLREEWGQGLIRSWNAVPSGGGDWITLAARVGDRIAPLIGAGTGEVHVGDSTSVSLFKALSAAARARPERRVIVVEPTTFPTDGYVAAGVADLLGLELRWCDPADPLAAVDGDVVVLALTHVDFRTGAMFDLPGITAGAHDAGALVLWDLCHSVGSVPLALDDWGVDLAVGCTYKYLNGGPGAPAFCYVAARHLDALTQPIQGWMGAVDPFLMGPTYAPAEGIRRFLSGTPPIVGMLALQDMLALVEEVGMAAVREKSVALTEHAIGLSDELLAPSGVEVASPRDASRRGGHVTLNHPLMREVTAALWEQDVIPDYRDPHGLRIGLSPLSTSFDEVERGLESVREVLARVTT